MPKHEIQNAEAAGFYKCHKCGDAENLWVQPSHTSIIYVGFYNLFSPDEPKLSSNSLSSYHWYPYITCCADGHKVGLTVTLWSLSRGVDHLCSGKPAVGCRSAVWGFTVGVTFFLMLSKIWIDRLLRCLSMSISPPESGCGSSGRGCCAPSAADLNLCRNKRSSALSTSSVALTRSERAALSLLRAALLSFIVWIFCIFSFLTTWSRASSSSLRNFESIENTSLICLSVSWPWTSVSLAVWSKFPLLSLKTCSFCCAGFRSSRSIFLWSRAASSTGLMVQLMCEFECKQMIQTGCWWSRQKSLSFSACRLHRAAGLVESLSVLSGKKASDKFFSGKFRGGSLCEDLLIHIGHSRVVFCVHHIWRQALQKLWPHVSRTGSLKMSWQTGHNRFSSDLVAIISVTQKVQQTQFLKQPQVLMTMRKN